MKKMSQQFKLKPGGYGLNNEAVGIKYLSNFYLAMKGKCR